MCHFRLELLVANVTTTIAGEIVHGHGHLIGRPWIELIKTGRPRFARIPEIKTLLFVRLVTKQGRQIDAVENAFVLAGIEGLRIGKPIEISVVSLYRPGISHNTLTTNAKQRGPERCPLALPFSKHAGLVARAVINVPEGIGAHAAPDRRPPVIQGVILGFHAQPDGVRIRRQQVGL